MGAINNRECETNILRRKLGRKLRKFQQIYESASLILFIKASKFPSKIIDILSDTYHSNFSVGSNCAGLI